MAAHRVLLAGGGSGGHVFPALALADELVERGTPVSFVGVAGGFEARLVSERGHDFHVLAARPIVGRGRAHQARAVATLLASATRGRALVRRLDARVVVGTGGYVSAPAVLGARLARRPALLFEPNAEAGAANVWLSRWATEAALAFPGSGSRLVCPWTVVGTPVRRSFFDVRPLRATGVPRLLILGGSQGAEAINRELPGALATLRAEGREVRAIHQTGERHLESARERYAEAGLADVVEVTPFVADVAGAMAEAWLVVSRAGAVTLAEICAAGRPALLLPLGLAGGHQVDNARAQVAQGVAEMLAPADASAEHISSMLGTLLSDPAELERRSVVARALASPDAASLLADRVEELSRRGTAGLPARGGAS